MAVLHWETLTETDVDYFVIEKSFNGVDYAPIGIVNSLYHNSTVPSFCNFTDSNTTDGTQFYRIQEVDMNGRGTYSTTVAITIRRPLLDMITLYPNPVHEQLIIRFFSILHGTGFCHIYSEEGREVMQTAISFESGSNELNFYTGGLLPGLYYVVFSQPDKRILEKNFLKL